MPKRYKAYQSQGLWELSPAGPLFYLSFFGQTAISPPFSSEELPQIGGKICKKTL
nr:MAG TPA: hypothetical protein [Caudoviricetes sp.]